MPLGNDVFENRITANTAEKAAQMGMPADVGVHGAEQKLDADPEKQVEISRYFDRDKQNDGAEFGFGTGDQIRAHHARNRAAGTDGRYGAAMFDKHIGQAADQPTDEVEDQVRQCAQTIFHVVTENVEKVHIADEMSQPGM